MRQPGDTDVVSRHEDDVPDGCDSVGARQMVVTQRTHAANAFAAEHRYRDVEVYYPSRDVAVEVPLA